VLIVNHNGQELWERNLSFPGWQTQIEELLPINENRIVSCGFRWPKPGNADRGSEGLIVSYNPLGDTSWLKILDVGYNLWLLAGAIYSDGGFVFTGCVQYDTTDKKDVIIIKTDSLGSVEWEKHVLLTGNEVATEIEVLPDGRILISGTRDYPSDKGFVIITDELGNMERIRVLGENGSNDQFVTAKRCPDGTILAVGAAVSDYSWLSIDYYIAKLDSNLGFLWDKKIPGEYIDYFQGFHIEDDGSFVVVGEGGMHTRDLFKFDPDGNILWRRIIDSPIPYAQRSLGLTKCSDGGYLISGCAGGWDTSYVWLTKTDSNGCLNPSCIGGVGVPDMAAPAQVAFYPSPAHSEVRLAGDAVYPVSVALHSTEGRRVLEATLRSANDALDVTALPAGVYVAQGADALGRVVRAKVLVE
jgi:hypothetical protein